MDAPVSVARATLSPMSVWDILDRSVRLYRRRVGTILPAAVLVALAIYPANRICLFALLHYVAGLERAPSGLAPALAALLVVLALSALVLALSFIQTGVMAVVICDAYFESEGAAPDGAGLKPSARPAGRLLSALRKVPLRSLVLSSLLAACVINLALLPLVVPAFVLAISFALVPLVAALEGPAGLSPGAGGTGAWACLRRSWRLVRARMGGGFWNSNVTRIVVIWAFGLVVLMLGYAIVMSLVEVVPESWKTTRTVDIPGIVTFSAPVLRTWPAVAFDLVGQVVCAFFQPFVFCALVLLYYDIRVAKEGIDIEWGLDRLGW